MNIQQYRQQIDSLDSRIVALLQERAQVAIQIGKIKQQKNREVLYDPAREAKLIKKLSSYAEGKLQQVHLQAIFREILSACLSLEQEQKIAFLGPEGTFTQMAALMQFGHSAHYVDTASIADVFTAVQRGHVQFGVVPIENSTEGMVSTTLDMFETTDLAIIGELELPVEHALLGQQAYQLADIQTIFGHEQALAQCQHWIRENLPQVHVEPVASNSRGAQLAADKSNSAAVASRVNAELYNLKVIADGIEDISGNKTRFVVLGNMEVVATGNDKTALLFGTYHRPGGLFQALQHFNDYKLDMSRLESRPMKTASWSYSFFVEFRGHKDDKHVKKALLSLEKDTTFIKLLGSFPVPAE